MGRRNRKGSKYTDSNKTIKGGNSQKGKDVETSSNTSGERRHIHGKENENGANDVTWYNHIYHVSEPLARVSYNIMTGAHYDPLSGNTHLRPYSGNGGWEATAVDTATVDPGIMTLYVQPVLGDVEAANVAATQIYSLVRQANSGAKNYDKTDLMMMIMAMDSAYMLYEYLLRAFRVCKSWDYLNRYTPEALLQAMGFDPAIMAELADFEATLNLFAYRLAALCVPDQFDFIHRHSWLFSNVYEDENNGRAQMYILNPSRLYVWTEGQDDEPTYLRPTFISSMATPPTSLIKSVSQIQEIIDTMLTPLFGSEDIALMNGDLIKAFGDGGMIKINPVDTTPLAPVHNDEVLEQIMNADVLATASDEIVFSDLSIRQDMSSLAAGPQLVQSLQYVAPTGSQAPRNAIKSLLNAFEDLSSDRIITSTRLKFTVKYTSGEGDKPGTEEIISCGTEFVERIVMWYRDSTNALAEEKFIPRPFPRPSQRNNFPTMVSLASRFRYHPTIYMFDSNSNRWQYMGYIQDSAVTAWLDDSWINKMNEVAVLSEYAVKDFKTGLS